MSSLQYEETTKKTDHLRSVIKPRVFIQTMIFCISFELYFPKCPLKECLRMSPKDKGSRLRVQQKRKKPQLFHWHNMPQFHCECFTLSTPPQFNLAVVLTVAFNYLDDSLPRAEMWSSKTIFENFRGKSSM